MEFLTKDKEKTDIPNKRLPKVLYIILLLPLLPSLHPPTLSTLKQLTACEGDEESMMSARTS
jgi:hypothetical protein